MIMYPNVTTKASALTVTKSEKGNQFILAVFSKSVVRGTTVPFNCFASSIRLPLRFHWHNFALALSARIFIAEFSAELRVVLV